MNKGFVWVNGHGIGRYWQIEAKGNCSACHYAGEFTPNKCRVGCGEPTQRYYHVPWEWLKVLSYGSFLRAAEREQFGCDI